MATPKKLIESGLLELYVIGEVSEEESLLVQSMAAAFYEVKDEITRIESILEKYAYENAIKPDPNTKVFIDASIDYAQRMANGEPFTQAPALSVSSKREDFSQWLNRSDMVMPHETENLFIKILSHTPEATTAIVWVRKGTPDEKHSNELESFYILEGTCTIAIEGQNHQLVPGDFITIPLHKEHKVTITSSIPCMAIIQRVAV